MADLITGITFVNTYNGGVGYWGGHHPRISYDGTLVAFDTVPGYASWVEYDGAQLPPFIDVSGTIMSSGAEHVYLKNLATGALAVLDPVVIGDFGLDEAPGGDTTSISADGRYVAYQVPGQYSFDLPMSGANVDQVNMVDTATGAITNPNTNASGVLGDGFSGNGALSATGRYVAFTSSSTNLVSNDTNGVNDVFLKDTVTGSISLVSATSSGTQGSSASIARSVSSDGRYVLFETFASNLGASSNILIKDMQSGALIGVGTTSLGSVSTGPSTMTPDGRYVVYDRNDGNFVRQVYRFDAVTGDTILVSRSSNGAGNDSSRAASISADGRYVVFESRASNFVSNDTNGFDNDIFVKDLSTGNIARLNVSATGMQALSGTGSMAPQISGDGRYVVFQSGSSNLISGDTNGNPDIFMVLNPFWQVPPPPTDEVQSSVSYTLPADIEDLVLIGTAHINGTGNGLANAITGNSGNNVLNGGGGNDTLAGNGGNDSLNGGAGNDSMTGGAGNDTFVRDAIGDILAEAAGGGIDLVQSSLSYMLPANFENLTLTGASAVNGTGNEAANVLTGNAAANTLNGSGGNDRLNGSGGADVLSGGSGNDTLFWDAVDTRADGGGGSGDTLKLGVNLNVLNLASGRLVNIERVDMNGSGNDTLTLNKAEVLDLSAQSNTLTVLGNAGDRVDLRGTGWSSTVAGGFETWKNGTAIVKVETELTVL